MAPIIHCVRHAQGVHNLALANHAITDPSITRYGEEQCRNLHRIFPSHAKIDLLVSSPLLRCIQTTMLSFHSSITDRGLQIVLHPDAQETTDMPCDTGKSPAELAVLLEGKPVDASLVHEGWNSNEGRYAMKVDAVKERARALRAWLRARPEREIVLVTHGGFLHWFTEDWVKAERREGAVSVGTSWANCEYRSYEFLPKDGESCSLRETSVSRKLRESASLKLVGDSERLLASKLATGRPKSVGKAVLMKVGHHAETDKDDAA